MSNVETHKLHEECRAKVDQFIERYGSEYDRTWLFAQLAKALDIPTSHVVIEAFDADTCRRAICEIAEIGGLIDDGEEQFDQGQDRYDLF